MNTPFPCNRCKNLYYNCLAVEDPTYTAECSITMFDSIGPPVKRSKERQPKWGKTNCPRFEMDPHCIPKVSKT